MGKHRPTAQKQAALSWAGVDPDDHDTWVVHRGDCPHVADEPSPWG